MKLSGFLLILSRIFRAPLKKVTRTTYFHYFSQAFEKNQIFLYAPIYLS